MYRIVIKKLLFPYKVFPIPKKHSNTNIVCKNKKLVCVETYEKTTYTNIVKYELFKRELER